MARFHYNRASYLVSPTTYPTCLRPNEKRLYQLPAGHYQRPVRQLLPLAKSHPIASFVSLLTFIRG